MQEEHRRAVDILQCQVERANTNAIFTRVETPTTKSPSHESDTDTDGARLHVHSEERQAAEVSIEIVVLLCTKLKAENLFEEVVK